MNIIDLHVHSTKSDGTLTPTELVQYAIEKGLSAFALTDHDTTDGIDEALTAAAEHNEAIKNGTKQGLLLEVIPGIEFSTEYMGKDIHILGLYIDYNSPAFKEKIQEFVDSRILRNQKMCASLASDGIDITYEKLLEANEQFHSMIYQMTGSRFIVQILKTYQDYVHIARKSTLKKEENLPLILKEHEAIYKAMVAKDIQAAADAVEIHMKNTAIRAKERWLEK